MNQKRSNFNTQTIFAFLKICLWAFFTFEFSFALFKICLRAFSSFLLSQFLFIIRTQLNFGRVLIYRLRYDGVHTLCSALGALNGGIMQGGLMNGTISGEWTPLFVYLGDVRYNGK